MKPDMFPSRAKRWPAVFVFALLASCGGGDDGYSSSTPAPSGATGTPTPSSMTRTLTATLNGGQETPPNPSSAAGTATATVDTAAESFTVSVTTTGVAGTAAHIHEGGMGVAGPIVFPLTQSPAGSGQWSTTAALNDAQLQALLAGSYYVNVHSAAYPGGEIRGQLVATAGGGNGGY